MLQPDLRNFEAMYFYGQPPIVKVRIIAKLVRMPDRQIIGVATFERCVRARADKVPKVVEAFDQALGSVIKRLVSWTLRTPPARPPSEIGALRYRALSQPGERRYRQRELSARPGHVDGALRRRVMRPSAQACFRRHCALAEEYAVSALAGLNALTVGPVT